MTGLVAAERGIGEFAVVDALPEAVVVAFAAVTHLADPWLLFAMLAVGYWFASEGVAGSPRRAGATAIAAVTCAYAATALGKAWFAAPRPPGAMPPADVPTWLPALLSGWYEAQVLSDGFGFPSGHATGGAAAYLALALLYDRLWTDRARYLAAGAVAVAVAASRVVIEVHYLVDVLAGLLVGAGTVAVALRLAGDPRVRGSSGTDAAAGPTADLNPAPAFALAAVVSAGALAVAVAGGHTGEVVEAGIGIATGAGGAIGWRFVDGEEPSVPPRVAVPALAVTGGLWVGAYALAGTLPVTLVATTAAVVAVVALPALSGRIERSLAE
ncbi:phosphatase PAP2 family protein [Halorubrum ezzemoulense]|uniref:phosphatase PAP2 family protein n=1 Tax=Halorubrum ezzemoulense TaxID=337243 RepID=UPI00232C0F26|nr:phosphatase PAP2 family protein [Halorubrum ezzemoulense]MDB2263806.1 phosphatase PAP2 family protein [Halorubrum ezzemoulense]MDB2269732.1 phosphatase PAP2 family protein [Halorubrum ezzemoulense]MDB9279643.1 phosphatase PAP2 family protein [Halorubrum ezzemoulense]MDB9283402.1 phosphatase PAP2 family protein [Halorubrum ezzemoulense]MDB9299468.1 phosphatase PAP2 family protein [Halorubrum ezzemoulense]